MDTSDLLLLEEVAEQARVTVDTVRYWVRSGKLASVRPGRRRMVRRQVLEAFLARGAIVEARSEPAA
jgi:excisionase family DNA binding protein